MPDAVTPAVRVSGRVFAANAALCHDAELLLDDRGDLRLYAPAQDPDRHPAVLDAKTLRWCERVGQTPLRVSLPDGRVFETRAFAAAEQLRRQLYCRAPRQWLQRLESLRARHLILAFSLLLSLTAAGIYRGLPWLADKSVRFVPLAWEERIGAGVLETLDATMTSDSTLSANARDEIQALFGDLLARQPAPHYAFALHFRQSKQLGANALALPGGLVVVTDDLVKLAADHDEIAGVLAHELGHVRHRHGLRGLARASGLSFVLLFVLGDGAGILNDAAAFGALFLQLSYSRVFEREADAHAVTLMRAAGRDPLALARMLERLQAARQRTSPASSADAQASASWLSTHPATGERIHAIRAQTAGAQR